MDEIKKFYNPKGKGFIPIYTEGDLKNWKSEQEDKKNNVYPWEDRLEIKHAKVGLYRIYYITCECGAMSEKLLVAERGLRCQQCGLFHRKETFNKLKVKIHNIARMAGDKIKVTAQPDLQRKIMYEKFLKEMKESKKYGRKFAARTNIPSFSTLSARPK